VCIHRRNVRGSKNNNHHKKTATMKFSTHVGGGVKKIWGTKSSIDRARPGDHIKRGTHSKGHRRRDKNPKKQNNQNAVSLFSPKLVRDPRMEKIDTKAKKAETGGDHIYENRWLKKSRGGDPKEGKGGRNDKKNEKVANKGYRGRLRGLRLRQRTGDESRDKKNKNEEKERVVTVPVA